ncbi:MAG: class I SAM-dependent methyltransferase [Actinomycetota bacterium]
MTEVDLDRLATSYAHRPPSEDSLRRAEQAGRRLPPEARVLDVGGGPGNHSAVWQRQGHAPIVLDPSAGMAETARTRGIAVVRGRSQAMPFRSGTFDLVWFHLSIHYGDWRRSIDEAVRVVAGNGRIDVWTLGPDHHEQSLLAEWFPSIAEIDGQRFPVPEMIASYLDAEGATVSVTHPVEVVTRKAGSWIAAVEAGFVSTLQLLPDDERRRGIEAAKRRYPNRDEEIGYELRFTRITADRSPSA